MAIVFSALQLANGTNLLAQPKRFLPIGFRVAIGGFLVSCENWVRLWFFFFKMADGKSKHIELTEELGEESGRNRDQGCLQKVM